MGEWLQGLPIGWMAAVFFGFSYLISAAIYMVVVVLTSGKWDRARLISSAMLSPMGALFALFVVFTAAEVWSDNDRATAAVAQEASALRSVLILASTFPGEPQDRLQTLVRLHIEQAKTTEWPMMAHQSATLKIVPLPLAEAMQFTLALMPSNPGQQIAQRGMASDLESALDARRQRILVSQSHVRPVKWVCLIAQALCVLLTIAFLHSDNRPAGTVALGLFATGAAACLLLIAAYDRPFMGALAVPPDPLMQIMPEIAHEDSERKPTDTPSLAPGSFSLR